MIFGLFDLCCDSWYGWCFVVIWCGSTHELGGGFGCLVMLMMVGAMVVAFGLGLIAVWVIALWVVVHCVCCFGLLRCCVVFCFYLVL